MNSSPVSLLLRNRHLLAMVIVVICVAGISSLTTMPRQEDPRITNRNPIVTTLMPGASAERVEALVTEKIEDALDEIAEIKNVESTSRPGISLISIELADAVTTNTNEDIFSKIRDRLDAASRDFPPEALPPDFDDKRGAVAFGLVVALQWQASSEVQLGLLDRLAETLADRLRNVPGTELVRLYGEPEEQLTLEVDPNELTALGLSTGILARRLAEADAKGPAGFWRSADTNLALEFSGELDSTARIRSIPILENEDGSVLRLGDLADVRKEYRSPPSEIGLSNGQRTVLLAARPQDGIRLDSWGEQARQEVAAYQTEIGGGIVLETVFDQSDYTQQRLSELGANLLMGALVILAVIGVMMGWRSSLLVGAALPLTALATVFVVASSGGELHQMSIFGMIIALGLLIDNAIVVVDEATQRLRRGMETLAAVEDTLRHLFVPLLASTLTTVLAFMPIVLLPGNAGDFVRSIGTSVMVALVSSFLISLGLILALTGLFGSRQPLPAPWWKVGFSSRRLEATYRKAMLWLMHRPLLAMALAMLFPLVGFGLATTLGSQFFPRVDRNMLEVTVRLPSQASIAATAASIRELDARLRNDPVVQRTDWLVGASYPSVYYNLVMNQDNTPSFAHGIITTQDAAQVEGLIRRIQALAARDFPGLEVTATEFAQGPPQDAPIVFRLFGPDNQRLQELGDTLRLALSKQPEVVNSRMSMSRDEAKLWIRADEDELQLAGLTLRDAANQLQSNLEGQTGGSVLEDLEELPVRIRYTNQQRGSIRDINSVNLVSPNARSEWIPLPALGELESAPAIGEISRYNGERMNRVLAETINEALPIDVTRRTLEELDASGFALPDSYRLELGGEAEQEGEAVGNLQLYLPVLVVVMVSALILAFRSVLWAGVLLAVALLSVGNGLLATWAWGFPISFNTILGSIGLIGVALNDSIVVLAGIRANPLAASGNPEAIVDEVLDRTRHIVATTLTTAGGFLPILLFDGGDFWPPLAVVLAGGVFGAMLLALFFVPTVFTLRRRHKTPSPLPQPVIH